MYMKKIYNKTLSNLSLMLCQKKEYFYFHAKIIQVKNIFQPHSKQFIDIQLFKSFVSRDPSVHKNMLLPSYLLQPKQRNQEYAYKQKNVHPHLVGSRATQLVENDSRKGRCMSCKGSYILPQTKRLKEKICENVLIGPTEKRDIFLLPYWHKEVGGVFHAPLLVNALLIASIQASLIF